MDELTEAEVEKLIDKAITALVGIVAIGTTMITGSMMLGQLI